MKLRELLEIQDQNQNFTFIIQENEKSGVSSMLRDVYKTTPIRPVWEWLSGTLPDEYIVLKKEQAPLDVTGTWSNWYENGELKCCIITKPETLIERYGEKQGNDMISFYERTVK